MNHNMQMQKETGKILHRKFLSENIGLLLIAPVFLLLLFIVSNLYQLPAEYIFYLTSIFLILWVTTLCMQYRGFRKRTEQYEKESKEKQESNSEESRQWEELQEKQDFFALWAHQIKTPIAALNLLLQGEKQDAAVCRQELFKIENYVEMALNYLRFEEISNDLVLERNSLEQLVRQVVKKYAAIFIYNHISIQLEHLDYTVLTDEKWFCFVLEQILSNALKYTKQGSVKISAEETENGLQIFVKDTGIGIKREDLPRIFEKGFTGYNGRMDKKASGLGLYLCKGVCEKLGRATYSWKDRYFAEFNIGYNGAENFSPKNRYGTFPAYGVGWVISNEKFWEPLSKVVSFLKIRYTDGKVGNSDVSDRRFMYLNQMKENGDYGYKLGPNGTKYSGYETLNMAVDLIWEEARKQDLGIDLKLFNDDLSIIFDIFKERRENILLKRENSIPSFLGYNTSAPYGNIGIVENKGFDATVEYNKRFNKDWTLASRGNITYNKDKWIEDNTFDDMEEIAEHMEGLGI